MRGISQTHFYTLLMSSVLLLVCGCSQVPFGDLNEAFYSHRSHHIEILPLENNTRLTDLESFTTTQRVQSLLFGPGEVDIVELIEQEAAFRLDDKGYSNFRVSLLDQEEIDRRSQNQANSQDGAPLKLKIGLNGLLRRNSAGWAVVEGLLGFKIYDFTEETLLYSADVRFNTRLNHSGRPERLTPSNIRLSIRRSIERAFEALPKNLEPSGEAS